MAGWLCALANISAVWPRQVSKAFTSAPRSISRIAASMDGVRATLIRAVWPSSVGDSTSAPASSRAFRIAKSPRTAASDIGDEP
jgi:hypothetical protein